VPDQLGLVAFSVQPSAEGSKAAESEWYFPG